jgi:hypothetical protein
MVDQRKVQPLIRNFKIDLASCVYKISIIILNLENGIETYSMLMGRPWLKQAKTHHNRGDNTFTITFEEKTIMLSIIKCVNIKSSQEPKNLDNEFEWEEGFLNKKKRNYTKQL